MFTNKSKIMNAGNYHSDMNNPDLVRQQLIQFVCRLTRSKFETREWNSNPLAVLGGSSLYGQYLFWKEIVVFLLLEDYDTDQQDLVRKELTSVQIWWNAIH